MAFYRFKAYYGLPTASTDEYSTEFEYNLDAMTITDNEIEQVATNVRLGLSEVLCNGMRIYRVVASTWSDDSEPYNPLTFRVFDTVGIGERIEVGFNLAPLEETVFIKRLVGSGRGGRLFIRGAVYFEELQRATEGWTLTTAGTANINAALISAYGHWSARPGLSMIGSSLIETVYPATEFGEKQIPYQVRGAAVARPVTGIELGGIRNRQLKQ